MPGYPCCPTDDPLSDTPCVSCAAYTTYKQYEVTISGLVADGCDPGETCEEFNGTFILDQEDPFDDNVCDWRYTLPGSVCGTTGEVLLRITFGGATAGVELWLLNGGSSFYQGLEMVNVYWDCEAGWDDVTFFKMSGSDCDTSAISVTIAPVT